MSTSGPGAPGGGVTSRARCSCSGAGGRARADQVGQEQRDVARTTAQVEDLHARADAGRGEELPGVGAAQLVLSDQSIRLARRPAQGMALRNARWRRIRHGHLRGVGPHEGRSEVT
jgi:hypothetical protein